MDVNIAAALLGHGRDVLHRAPARQVVVAQEQPGLVGEGQQAADRPVQGACVGAGEVAARRTVVGHEQRVADEHRRFTTIHHHITHACRGVPRGVQGTGVQVADAKTFLVLKQYIELAAVPGKTRLGIEQRAEDFLHLGDVRTDGGVAAKFFLQVGGCRKVIGVNMGFQNPLHLATQRLNLGDQAVCRCGAGTPGLGVVVQHTVDQRALARLAVHEQVADGRGRLVEEGFHVKVVTDDHHVLQSFLHPL
ncbi:hypothetical protein D3C80_1224650 [compost metagenome]